MVLADFVGTLELIEIMKTYVLAKNPNIQNFDVITESYLIACIFKSIRNLWTECNSQRMKVFFLNLFHTL